ncbi:MAG: hypothetical protein JW896_05155 [Deltaproteobacteria bacterium]|nr:hypothetical protein [Deltaproteobacteria bacterium]
MSVNGETTPLSFAPFDLWSIPAIRVELRQSSGVARPVGLSSILRYPLHMMMRRFQDWMGRYLSTAEVKPVISRNPLTGLPNHGIEPCRSAQERWQPLHNHRFFHFFGSIRFINGFEEMGDWTNP